MIHRIERFSLTCTCGRKFTTQTAAIDHSQAEAIKLGEKTKKEKS